VRPLAISYAPIEPMGGGADTLSESKSHSPPGVRPGHGEKALSYPWFTRTRRGRWDAAGIDAWGRVTKIVDRRQASVRAAAAGYRASPGESAPSCGTTLAAVPEGLSQGPVTGRRRLSRGLAPNTVFVLEQSFLLHHTAAAALIHASPAAATDGTGVALDGGVGETQGGTS
jgi:hypothetical protein